MKNPILKWALAICFSLMASLSWSQGYEERIANNDIEHYRFVLRIQDGSDVVAGMATITFKQIEDSEELLLDLVVQDEEGKGMRILELSENGQNLSYQHEGELIKVKLAKHGKDMRHTIRVQYEGIPLDGLIIGQNRHGGRTFFGDNWPNRAHHWLPCVDHPSDKATVEFIVNAPRHYGIVANGNRESHEEKENGEQTSHWRCQVPLPTKVMVFGAAEFAVEDLPAVQGIPLCTWVFAKDKEKGFYDYAQADGILAWFMKTVAEYPYEKLANVQSQTRYGGMENASCIFYAETSVTGDRSCEALMAHEIAHQWFGNSASEANWHHIWLSEGFATYFTDLYFEQVHGRDTFLARLGNEREAILNWTPTWKYALVAPEIQNLNNLLNINSYQKGAWVLHMLRTKVGEEAFFKGIRSYYQAFKFGNALSKDLQQHLEKASGQDLSGFFAQWVFRPGHPKLNCTYEWKAKKGKLRLDLEQTQSTGAMEFPLKLAFHLENGEVQQQILQVNKAEQSFWIPLPDEVSKVVLDPEIELLFEGKIAAKSSK